MKFMPSEDGTKKIVKDFFRLHNPQSNLQSHHRWKPESLKALSPRSLPANYLFNENKRRSFQFKACLVKNHIREKSALLIDLNRYRSKVCLLKEWRSMRKRLVAHNFSESFHTPRGNEATWLLWTNYCWSKSSVVICFQSLVKGKVWGGLMY